MNKLVNVNRLEIIDHTSTGTGRDFVKWVEENFDVDYDIQDNGQTIKIFLEDMPNPAQYKLKEKDSNVPHLS